MFLCQKVDHADEEHPVDVVVVEDVNAFISSIQIR